MCVGEGRTEVLGRGGEEEGGEWDWWEAETGCWGRPKLAAGEVKLAAGEAETGGFEAENAVRD